MLRKSGPSKFRKTIRCAVYTRQSAASDDDLSSCEVQYEICTAYIRSHRTEGWQFVDARFDDDGFSGASLDRPALTRLRDLVRKREVDTVVVHRLDRLARSLLGSATLLQELRRQDVRLVIVTAPELGQAPGDNFMFNILASFAEFERDMIASRIAESRTRLRARGQRLGGSVPFGYVADLHTKQLLTLEAEAEIVKWMFGQAAGGQVPAKLAEEANSKGWRTKVRFRRRTTKTFGGNLWTSRQVLATLRNPVYIGMFPEGRGARAGCHEPIVAKELFEAVGLQLDSRKPRLAGRFSYGNVWPLKGLIRCGVCDRPMTPHTVRHGNKVYRYYRCRSTAGGLRPCGGQVGAGHIEDAICRQVPFPRAVRGRKYIQPEAISEFVATLRSRYEIKWTLFGAWKDGIVPFSVEVIRCNLNGSELGIGDFDSLLVECVIDCGAHVKSLLRSSRGDQIDDYFMADQWLSTPVQADERKQAMFDLVPLAGAGREVTHADGHSKLVRKLL